MKQLPKQEQPDVAGGATPEYPQVPCFPTLWPKVEDGPTCPEEPDPGCQSPSTI
jgi:hypothetical protein